MAQHNLGSAEKVEPTKKPNSMTLPTCSGFQVCSGADVVAVVVVLSHDAIVQQTRDILELGPVREVFTRRTYWWNAALIQRPAKTFMTVVQSTTPSQSPLVSTVAFASFGP